MLRFKSILTHLRLNDFAFLTLSPAHGCYSCMLNYLTKGFSEFMLILQMDIYNNDNASYRWIYMYIEYINMDIEYIFEK